MTDKITALICMPAGTPCLVPDGSQIRTCSQCQQHVWVSEEMLKHVDADVSIVPLCLDCQPLVSHAHASIHPDQVEPFREYGIMDWALDWIGERNRK